MKQQNYMQKKNIFLQRTSDTKFEREGGGERESS